MGHSQQHLRQSLHAACRDQNVPEGSKGTSPADMELPANELHLEILLNNLREKHTHKRLLTMTGQINEHSQLFSLLAVGD